MFQHHTDIFNNLHSYAERFGLTPHIQLNTEAEGRGER
jgi:hypothetical protein